MKLGTFLFILLGFYLITPVALGQCAAIVVKAYQQEIINDTR